MDAVAIAKRMGIEDGECREALVEFLMDPAGWCTTPSEMADMSNALKNVSDMLMDAAKELADSDMGTAGKIVDGRWEFTRRAPSRAQVVNQKAIRAIYPPDSHPDYYSTQERRGGIAARLLKESA